MRHTKTPEVPGWYWIANNPDQTDGWNMAFWDAEAPSPVLYVYDPQAATVFEKDFPDFGVSKWRPLEDGSAHHWQDGYGTWIGPVVWIGPIGQPGGPFGETICEADQETHAKAAETKEVIEIVYREYTHCDAHGGSMTVVRIRPSSELHVEKN